MVTEQSKHQILFPYVTMKWLLADLVTRIPIIKNSKISGIFGKKRVEGIEFLEKNGQKRYVECDTLIFTGDWIPEHELARLGGLDIDPVTRGPKINEEFQSTVTGVFVAGNLLRGVETADRCALEGKRTAKSMLRFLKNI
jgi:thioredoxin reductase